MSDPRSPGDDLPGDPVASGLTHIDATGAARMVDVGGKSVSDRVAVAGGTFRTTAQVIDALSDGALAKGDALATARIAAIMGAKRTPDLIPLCHQVALSSVTVDFTIAAESIDVTATAATSDRTGVEMEALTAVAVAGLTLHDMVKALDPWASMTDIRLLTKSGGKRGTWSR
ncbi:MAG: cyclic pyranopterin monophosphate synthase MoaC [Corynebacteriales bacterium]|uniref:cyclic pyranopterin monophosphate synthase n=2 Tax=Williamsia herbipolensis TaxID=1603258 RepID=A0AAU4K111_9NOCA|nr:cyclic pyranopterin monophosphate synthase MoaC [Williamsia herbipolensis]MCX6467846.1 cyclic pyranopterin monophosphate synthase MoaC [Mycobacteriales bacterium]